MTGACSAAAGDVASPCTGRCLIGADDQCDGRACTLDEIARWGGASNAERRAILAALPARRRRGMRDQLIT